MVDACMVNGCQSDLPSVRGCGYECGETSRRAVGPAPRTHKENNAKGRWLGAGCRRMQPKPIMCFAKEIPSYRAPGKILCYLGERSVQARSCLLVEGISIGLNMNSPCEHMCGYGCQELGRMMNSPVTYIITFRVA